MFRQFVNLCHYTQSRLYLVWDILHQFFRILQTDNCSFVVHSDINRPSLGIGKSTNPFQVLRTPRFFVLDILVFIHRFTCFCIITSINAPIPIILPEQQPQKSLFHQKHFTHLSLPYKRKSPDARVIYRIFRCDRNNLQRYSLSRHGLPGGRKNLELLPRLRIRRVYCTDGTQTMDSDHAVTVGLKG